MRRLSFFLAFQHLNLDTNPRVLMTVSTHSNTGVMGSNPTRGMYACMFNLSLCYSMCR
jgi:hypothetical protein